MNTLDIIPGSIKCVKYLSDMGSHQETKLPSAWLSTFMTTVVQNAVEEMQSICVKPAIWVLFVGQTATAKVKARGTPFPVIIRSTSKLTVLHLNLSKFTEMERFIQIQFAFASKYFKLI